MHRTKTAVLSQAEVPHLDAVCRTAAALLNVKFASVSQLDEHRQHYIGREGFGATSTPRDVAICDHTLRGKAHEFFVVLDTHDDPRFAENPLVIGPPYLRFYAGVPVGLDDGTNLASVCVADPEPRTGFGDDERQRLLDLSLIVEGTLRGRIAQRETARVLEALQAEVDQRMEAEALAARQQAKLSEEQEAERVAQEVAGFGRWSFNVADGTMVWSKGFAGLLGRASMADRPLSLQQHIEVYHPDERAMVAASIERGLRREAVAEDQSFVRRGRMLHANGDVLEVIVHGSIVRDAAGAISSLRGITLDMTELTRAERLLNASNAQLRATLEHMDQGLMVLDPNLRVRLFNERAIAMLNLPEGVLQEGTAATDVMEFIDVNAQTERFASAGLGFENIPSRVEWKRSNGSTFEVRHTILPDGGRIFTFTDVTAPRAAEVAVQESERRLRMIAENASDVIILGNLAMERLYVSPGVNAMLGYTPEEFAVGRSIDYTHPDDAHIFAEHWSKLTHERPERTVCTLRYRHKAGHYLWVEVSNSAAREPRSGAVIGYVASLRDVTARREAEEQVRHMALHDGMTGLPNRTLFRDRLDQAIVHAGRTGDCFAVMIGDLDRFKAINDSFGHQIGDALLQIVGERMKNALSPYDTVARFGGDEFGIILPHLETPGSAATFAERLIDAISQPVELEGHTVEVGVSIGLTVAFDANREGDELFRRADIALYQAKAAGRNTFRQFCPSTGDRVATRSQLGLDMKEALRRGEFRLVYQPVVDAVTSEIVCFEALMRWRHPERGEISPGEFIPVAEDTGLIASLGVWALQEACRAAALWPSHVQVAVNVSAVQLRREGLETALLAALAASSLPAERLKLEVTESVMMEDADEVLERLNRLHNLGVLIALDDFGTGYSSLSYLRRFPFEKIKIDRSFIGDIANPDAAAIVRAVVGICEQLGMGVVAEGVETAEQLALVRAEGCQQVQGYFFSRPLPRDEVSGYIQAATRKAA